MNNIARPSGRTPDQPRAISFEKGWITTVPASVLVAYGNTRVVCTASVENRVPPFLRGQNQGWLTAEYGMLPASTNTRMMRESARGKQTGRTQEIQRLIGRSLRACLDLSALGERTITIDCDVLQADGGTRTAAISGGYVALCEAIKQMSDLTSNPVHGMIAAISTGIYNGSAVLDLDYAEDCTAETDMNVVMNDSGHYIEVQATAEGHAFKGEELDTMLKLAKQGIEEVMSLQRACIDA